MIKLTEQHLTEIRQHGERDYPYECCGLLIGKFADDHKVVIETYPISNAREEEAKRNRFLIRPAELMRGERHAREHALDVVGFYHSHPDDRPVPSPYDLEHAWPTYSYIVVAVTKGSADGLRSWEMEPDRSRFNEEEISMTSVSEARPEGRATPAKRALADARASDTEEGNAHVSNYRHTDGPAPVRRRAIRSQSRSHDCR